MKYASSLCIALCLLFNSNLFSQSTSTCINIDANPFGHAEISSGFEYIITKKQTYQIGGFWGNSSISLDDDFDFSFKIYLGDNDAGADGVAFLLRGVGSQGQGSSGGGVGYQGISPSFAVEFDTYANGSNGDPSQDHTAIQLNGNPNHNDSSANIFGPVNIGTGGNIEDDADHEVRFVWEAATNTFTYYFDKVELTQITRDLKAHFGTNEVIWGFTGSTGGFFNEQKICALTAINSNLDKDKDGILDSIECNGSINCQNTDAPADTLPNNEDLDADGDGCFDAFEAGVSNDNTPYPDSVTDINNLVIDTSNGLITNSTIINNNGGYHANASDLPDDNGNGIPNILEPVDLSFTTNQNVSNQTVEQNQDIKFTFKAPNNNLEIKWEVSTDGGNSWTLLTNTAPYSGATTDELTISNVPASFNGNSYKATINDRKYTCAGINESEVGILTVTGPPDLDIDNDGVLDTIECRGIAPCPDDDGDTFANNEDLDSDNDGCPDAVEAGYVTSTEHPDNLTAATITEDIDGLINNSPYINANGYITNLSNLNGNATLDVFEKYELNFSLNGTIDDLLTVNEGENAVFKFTTNQTLMNIQWEESSDGGSTWSTLSNGLIYSGVNNHTLIINNVTIAMNKNLYRAIISSGNDFSCTKTIQGQGELRVFIPINVPTGFSPNGDGINDTFVIDELKHFPNYKIEIYNRNGNLVYKGNLDTPAWNGVSTSSAFGKDKVPAGVYFYVLDVQEDGYQPIQGYVHLRK